MSSRSNVPYFVTHDSDDYSREDEVQKAVASHCDGVRRSVLSRVDEGMIALQNTGKPYITIVILCIINFINCVIRHTITGASDDIRTFYSITEKQFRFLETVFFLSYVVVAPIYGYCGDRYKRKTLLSFSVTFWSISTFAGSFIPSDYYKIFLLLRILMGVGEVCCAVIAPTVIADLFAKDARSRILAVFYLTIPLGNGVGYFMSSQITVIPRCWQWIMRIAPSIGIVCSIVTFIFIREPHKGEIEGGFVTQGSSLLSDLVDLYKTPSFRWSTLGWTCSSFTIGTLSRWGPKYFDLAIHLHPHWQHIDAYLLYQVLAVVAGIIGIVIGSSISQYGRRCNPRADPLMCAFSVFIGIPFIFCGIVVAATHFITATVLLFIGEICLFMNMPVVADMLLYVIIPTRRSIAEAVQLFTSCLLGDISSPYICEAVATAISSFQIMKTSTMNNFLGLQYSFYIPTAILVFGGLCFLLTAFHIEKDRITCSLVTQGVIAPLRIQPNDLVFPQPVQLAADHVPQNDRAYLV